MCNTVPADLQHAVAEVDTDHAPPAEWSKYLDRCARAAAQVQPGAERTHFSKRFRHGVEEPLRRAKRRVVELRRQQVVAALGGRQCLPGQLEEGWAFGMEHHAYSNAGGQRRESEGENRLHFAPARGFSDAKRKLRSLQ